MAFGDWDIHTLNNVTIIPEVTTPILGLQSLSIEKFSGGTVTAAGAVTPSVASGLTKGIEQGRMRTIMQKVSGIPSTTNSAGIFCMTDSPNPILSSVDSYTLDVDGFGNIYVRARTTGLAASTGITTLLTLNSVIADVTMPFTVELLWFFDIPEFNGTRLQVKTGLALDYSDLAPVPGGDVIDSPTNSTVSFSEGVFYSTNASGLEARWLFEKTQLYSVSFA